MNEKDNPASWHQMRVYMNNVRRMRNGQEACLECQWNDEFMQVMGWDIPANDALFFNPTNAA